MSVGKRYSTQDPLTEHDVAERLSHAMLRTWKILADINNDPVLRDAVASSRFLVSGVTEGLAEALAAFKDPHPMTSPQELKGRIEDLRAQFFNQP